MSDEMTPEQYAFALQMAAKLLGFAQSSDAAQGPRVTSAALIEATVQHMAAQGVEAARIVAHFREVADAIEAGAPPVPPPTH